MAPKRIIAVVTACMSPDGRAQFAFNQVEATEDEIENGIHLYWVEAELLESGFEEPFVHFDEEDAPAFLHPAVRKHLGVASIIAYLTPAIQLEKT